MPVPAFATPFTYPSPFSPGGILLRSSHPLERSAQLDVRKPGSDGPQQLQQAFPLLQIVPQQLQHLQQLVSVQLQELQQLQQIIQLLPAQLQQLHQLIQFVPQQLQQFQQPQFQQRFGPGAGLAVLRPRPGGSGLTPSAHSRAR